LNKIVVASGNKKQLGAVVKAHKDSLEFIDEHISKPRLRAFKASKDPKASDEVKLREKVRYKKILAFELLMNNLSLLLGVVPEMIEEL